MHKFANPAQFTKLATSILPWTSSFAAVCFLFGLYFGIFDSPADYQQGETVRIMYVHVPAAWMSLFTYSLMAAASASFLIWKHSLADIAARSLAPIGAAFTAITLITVRPMGTTYVGNVVGMGCAFNVSSCPIFFIPRIYGFGKRI